MNHTPVYSLTQIEPPIEASSEAAQVSDQRYFEAEGLELAA